MGIDGWIDGWMDGLMDLDRKIDRKFAEPADYTAELEEYGEPALDPDPVSVRGHRPHPSLLHPTLL